MAAALRELIKENDRRKSEKGQVSGSGESPGKGFLEVIRLLVEMDPEERIALIGLLKALG